VTEAAEGASDKYADGLSEQDVVCESTKEHRSGSGRLAGFLRGVFVIAARPVTSRGRRSSRRTSSGPTGELLSPASAGRAGPSSTLEERGLAKRKTDERTARNGIRCAQQTDMGLNHAEPETETELIPEEWPAEAFGSTAPTTTRSLSGPSPRLSTRSGGAKACPSPPLEVRPSRAVRRKVQAHRPHYGNALPQFW